jgi:hypothetical protein
MLSRSEPELAREGNVGDPSPLSLDGHHPSPARPRPKPLPSVRDRVPSSSQAMDHLASIDSFGLVTHHSFASGRDAPHFVSRSSRSR